MAPNSRRFTFDGGAGTYVGTGILAFLITVFTLGICYPFAVVLKQRWRAKHSYIDGRRLVFTGSAWGLFGNWIKWLLLIVITLGIYGFWVIPRMQRWIWVHTDFDPAFAPLANSAAGGAVTATRADAAPFPYTPAPELAPAPVATAAPVLEAGNAPFVPTGEAPEPRDTPGV